MTGRGWAILAASLVSIGAGRLLGLEDLFLVGAGLMFILLVAIVYVRVVRADLEATRRVLPARVHAGGSSRVELSLVNPTRRRTPVLSVRDPFDGGARWARFLVAPLSPGEVARAAYRLPTERRGVFDLGPLEVGLTDPFGLAGVVIEGAPQTRLTVYPRIDEIAPPPGGHGDDPLAGSDHPRALTGGGEDFYALRPYERGDDLRKVHWPSTAKADDLMLRQDEMPWQTRATLVLDSRAETCPPVAFEALVSAAASIVVASARHDSLVRVVTTGGFDSRSSAGAAHSESILEHLAAVRTSRGQWTNAVAAVRRASGGGSVIALTTDLAPRADIQALLGMRHRFGTMILVVAETGAGGLDLPSGVRVVRITPIQPFATGWAAMTSGSAMARRR